MSSREHDCPLCGKEWHCEGCHTREGTRLCDECSTQQAQQVPPADEPCGVLDPGKCQEAPETGAYLGIEQRSVTVAGAEGSQSRESTPAPSVSTHQDDAARLSWNREESIPVRNGYAAQMYTQGFRAGSAWKSSQDGNATHQQRLLNNVAERAIAYWRKWRGQDGGLGAGNKQPFNDLMLAIEALVTARSTSHDSTKGDEK